jgi:hypothetical protein
LSGLVSELLRGGGKSIRPSTTSTTEYSGRSLRASPAGRVAYRVGHQAHIYAAIVGAARFRLVRLERLVLAQPDHVNLMCRNVVLRSQILNHGVRAALAQIVVVLGRAHGIRAAFERNDVSLGAGEMVPAN